jgi:methionine aminopeptidase
MLSGAERRTPLNSRHAYRRSAEPPEPVGAVPERWNYRCHDRTGFSVNDEAVHGIPGARRLRSGDIVTLDVTIEKDGFMADAAVTVAVGAVPNQTRRLIACAERAL